MQRRLSRAAMVGLAAAATTAAACEEASFTPFYGGSPTDPDASPPYVRFPDAEAAAPVVADDAAAESDAAPDSEAADAADD